MTDYSWTRFSVSFVSLAVTVACASGAEDGRGAAPLTQQEVLLDIQRTTNADGHVLNEVVRGDVDIDIESLIRSGDYALTLTAGSQDGTTTVSSLTVSRADTAPNLDTDRVRPEADESDAARLARVLDADLFEIALNLDSTGHDVRFVDAIVSFADRSSDPVSDIVAERRRELADMSPDVVELRDAAINVRLEQDRQALREVEARVAERFDMEVLEEFVVANAIFARVPRANLIELARSTDVQRLQQDGPVVQETVSGWEVARATQMDQYLSTGFDGISGSSGVGIRLGVFDQHFEDDFESITYSRVAEEWDCSTVPCTALSNMNADLTNVSFFWNHRHGTVVAQIVNGSPGTYNPGTGSYNDTHGGIARRAKFYLVRINVASEYLRGLDRMITSQVDIVSSSIGESTSISAADCAGTTSGSIALNNAVRVYGLRWFQAAGNSGHSGLSCSIRAPAGASWAFPVGAISSLGETSTPASGYTTMQGSAIASYSSRGYAAYLGGYRSIIGTATVGTQIYLPHNAAVVPNLYGQDMYDEGTSFAQPVVAGAGIDILDWMTHNWPFNFYTAPGYFNATLLLMGDRQREAGGTALDGFDSLFGSGRFRARMFTSAQMDDPWIFGLTSRTVSPNTVYSIPLPPIPAAADRLVIVAWWPEPDFTNGADMTMSATSDASPAGYRIDASYDTRKRLFISGSFVGGHTWTVRLNTYGIPANPWAGGATTRDVYIAYYYEDEARDDLPVGIQ